MLPPSLMGPPGQTVEAPSPLVVVVGATMAAAEVLTIAITTTIMTTTIPTADMTDMEGECIGAALFLIPLEGMIFTDSHKHLRKEPVIDYSPIVSVVKASWGMVSGFHKPEQCKAMLYTQQKFWDFEVPFQVFPLRSSPW